MAEPECLRITAGLDDLAEIRRFVRGVAARGGGDPDAVAGMLLALNEATTNIIEHGYQGARGTFEVEVAYDGEALTVRLRDRARAFGLSLAPEPDVTRPLDRRPVGGMGIHMTRQLTDELSYRSGPDSWNELVLIKRCARNLQ